MRSHGEQESSLVFKKLPQWRLIAALLLLIPCLLVASHPAKADWWDPFPELIYPPGTNYGADYWGAACADMYETYQKPCQISDGFGYNQGEPTYFENRWIDPLGAYSLYGFASNICPLNSVATITGCAFEADQQGCSFTSGNPSNSDQQTSPSEPDGSGQCGVGDPVNVASGNVYESATDFKTVGQESLTSRRYYNSDLSYASGGQTLYTNPNLSPAAPVYSFVYSRFGYGWRSEYDRFLIPNNTTPGSATAVDAIRADGTPVHFALSGSTWYASYFTVSTRTWSSPSDPRHNVNIRISTHGTYWYVTDSDDIVDKYDATGKLLTATYRNGYQQSLYL